MKTLTVRENRLGPVLGRHPWVFSQALTHLPEGMEPGEPVTLQSERGAFLAQGYFGSYSQIAVRLWGFDEREEVDKDFFLRRIRAAWQRRRALLSSETNAYRVVHGENDLLPGLVVDRYDKWLALQCHTRGIERWKPMILEALIEVHKPKGIYERSEAAARRIEGLGSSSALLYGAIPEHITILENGLTFLVDMAGGQKTGFFLDQRDKRAATRAIARDKRVLNAFSYTGGFTVAALAGGAREVTSVDLSAPALSLARKNVELNGFEMDRCKFVEADVKAFLKDIRPGQFDLIVLDPPAFIKDRKKKREGLLGYRGINESAIRALEPGCVLLTCSCSSHLPMEEFRYLLSEAGGRTHRTLRILQSFTHGQDHPTLVPFTEGEYLKCLVIEVE